MIDAILKSPEGEKIVNSILDAYSDMLKKIKNLNSKIDDLNYELVELNKKLSKKN